ncbi:nucleoside deaminase [OCS116 cluster bacterium]|nr:nucleoside deaminase [OCS116 cluster bacterium]
MTKTKYFMKLALSEAEKAKKRDEVPVGAIIVNQKNEIISSNGNRMRELNDPTAHAEVLVIRNACKTLKTTKLFGFSLFTTLEPCAMCAMTISLVGIKDLYFAAEDKKKGCVENGIRIFSSDSCHHEPNVYNGFYKREAEDLLKKFFAQRR